MNDKGRASCVFIKEGLVYLFFENFRFRQEKEGKICSVISTKKPHFAVSFPALSTDRSPRSVKRTEIRSILLSSPDPARQDPE